MNIFISFSILDVTKQAFPKITEAEVNRITSNWLNQAKFRMIHKYDISLILPQILLRFLSNIQFLFQIGETEKAINRRMYKRSRKLLK